MTMSTLGLTDGLVEVISTYVAGPVTVDAVATAPAWVILSSFRIPVNVSVQMEVVGLVDAGNAMSVRLYDVTDAEVVSGSEVDVSGTIDDRELSGNFDLLGSKVYQYQVQVIGPAGVGILRSAQLNST